MDVIETPVAPAAPAVPAVPVVPVAAAGPAGASATGTTVQTDWKKYDGKDANATMVKGLEICFASIIAIFIILGIYYLALKVLMRLFPAKA